MKKIIWTPMAMLICWLAPLPAQGQVVILHSFAGGNSDGANPQSTLAAAGSTLFGFAEAGGSPADAGTIFRLGVDGSNYNTIYTFMNGADGNGLLGSPILSGSTIFGTTALAGNGGQGTAFGIGTNGAGFGVIHSFPSSAADGANPQGTLAQVGSVLYGTTGFGGSGGKGTIFKVNSDSTGYIVLHSFQGGASDGDNPVGGAPAISGGFLYGTTIGGGSSDAGVVYRMNLDGTGFTILHSFSHAPTDGAGPSGSVIISGNSIYGMTGGGGAAGNGIVFKMNLDGTAFTVLHSFTGGPTDGRNPLGDLLLSNSTLYGTTYHGGPGDTGITSPGLGTLFSVGIDGSGYSILHFFAGGAFDGAVPAADVIQIGSTLYGTTVLGGSFNEGTVFSFTPVPEPSSLVLLAAAAGAGILVRRWRRPR